MKIYEKYHSHRKGQRKIISSNDFTYRFLINDIFKFEKEILTVLDIGCGVGSIDFFLANQGKQVTGIDISKKAILRARKDAEKFGLIKKVTFKNMQFPNNNIKEKFDLVICSEILEHLLDDEAAVKKIATLLKPHGIVIASSPSISAPLYRLGFLEKFDKEVGHIRRYNSKDFINLFIKNGFKILEFKRTEGIFRNYLFTSKFGGFMLKLFNKFPLSIIVIKIDDLLTILFGESDLRIIGRKK